MSQRSKKFTKTPTISEFLTAFKRGISLGWKNFWRNAFLSFATITVMAIILFIFNIILAVQNITYQGLQTLAEKVDLVITLANTVDCDDALPLIERLNDLEGVKEVHCTSKEDALQLVTERHPKTAEFLKKFEQENPLSATISITTETPEHYDDIAAFLNTGTYREMIEKYRDQSGEEVDNEILTGVAQNLQDISRFVRQLVFWIVLVFMIGGTLMIMNAVQFTLYHRSEEIMIMRLVGAAHSFIHLPFLFEGVLYALGAVSLSTIILLIIINTFPLATNSLWDFSQILSIERIILAELAVTLFISLLSSFVSVEQYVRGKLSH